MPINTPATPSTPSSFYNNTSNDGSNNDINAFGPDRCQLIVKW